MENFLKTETEEDPKITALADEIRETEKLRITTFPGENPAFDKILEAYDITEYESEKTDFSFLISEVKNMMFDEKTDRTRSLEEATPKELELSLLPIRDFEDEQETEAYKKGLCVLLER